MPSCICAVTTSNGYLLRKWKCTMTKVDEGEPNEKGRKELVVGGRAGWAKEQEERDLL